MILAQAQIKYDSETEDDLRVAFQNLRRILENEVGFLGLEVFADRKNSSVVQFVTRWTDSGRFERWRENSRGRLPIPVSAAAPVENALAEALILERVGEGDRRNALDHQAFDSIPLLARYVCESRTIHYVVASTDGTIRRFNQAVATHLKVPAPQLQGLKLWSYLSEDDAGRLRRQVQSGVRGLQEKLLINFVDAEHFPYSLECRLDVQPNYFTLIGEFPEKEESVLREHLLQITNQLAAQTRENALKSKALEKSKADLEKALNELNTSYWHMRKISEFLPICMQCHRVRTAEAHWENVADYLNKHSLFLTHSLCPPCYAAMIKDVNRLNNKGP